MKRPSIALFVLAALLAAAMPGRAWSASPHWRTYRNPAAGYSVRYPPTWTVHEQSYPGGSSVTTFTPPTGGNGITITAYPPDSDQPETDIPNRYCTAIKIHGLSAFRCFDTIAFSRSTEIFGPRATYTVAMAGRRADYQTYERLVNSFRLISG